MNRPNGQPLVYFSIGCNKNINWKNANNSAISRPIFEILAPIDREAFNVTTKITLGAVNIPRGQLGQMSTVHKIFRKFIWMNVHAGGGGSKTAQNLSTWNMDSPLCIFQ